MAARPIDLTLTNRAPPVDFRNANLSEGAHDEVGKVALAFGLSSPVELTRTGSQTVSMVVSGAGRDEVRRLPARVLCCSTRSDMEESLTFTLLRLLPLNVRTLTDRWEVVYSYDSP